MMIITFKILKDHYLVYDDDECPWLDDDQSP